MQSNNFTAKQLRPWCLLLTGALGLASGCAGGSSGLAARGQSDDIIQLVADTKYDTGNVQGPTERHLQERSWQKRREEIKADPNSSMAADLDRFENAVAMLDAGKYNEAEKEFKSLAEARRDTYESFNVRWRRWWGLGDVEQFDPYSSFGDPIEEDALFMLGETQFAMQRYASAQDSYDDLLKRYPSTRHLDQVTRQLFRIARYWLEFPEDVGAQGDAEVKVASAESKPQELSTYRRIAVLPNLTDRSRPTFDTYGRGLLALRSIWLHDATGPLADDALMLSANHNLRTGNYVEAARLYKLLREQYPDSQHFKDAFIIGSHVTLASYQGPAYDSQSLEEARELKVAALQLFPDLDPEQRQRLQEEVTKLQRAEEARLWDIVEFYQVKGVPEGVTLHCNLIMNRYPDSPYAEQARQVLIQQRAEREQGSSGSRWNPLARSSASSPVETGEPVAPATPKPELKSNQPLAMPAESPARTSEESPERVSPWKRFGNLLRRAEEPPKLQSPPSESQPSSTDAGRASL